MEGEPCSPVVVEGPGDDNLPAYLSNGLIGLRVLQVPLQSGVAVVNGLAEAHESTEVEGTGRAPYPLAGDIQIGGVRLADFPAQVTSVRQRYDFTCGELLSTFTFATPAATAEVQVVTFCSRTHPTVAAQRVAIRVDRRCDLELAARIDVNGVPGRVQGSLDQAGDDRGAVVAGLHWETNGGVMTCGTAVAVAFSDPTAAARVATFNTQAGTIVTHGCAARADTWYVMTQMAAMVPSLVHEQPHREAARLATDAARLGFDVLRQRNRECWAELWRARPILHGADRGWQELADAAYFYLNTSAHGSSVSSTHIFGLSQWHDYHYYYGHVMWDIEAFAVPVLLLTQPPAARSILDFRLRSLRAAHLNAQVNGYRGLQFPWEAAPRRGEEASPGSAEGAAFEHHISADVAIAFAKYVEVTGDAEFDRVHAWPVLKGVAEWIESRVVSTERGYEIHRATGIAERTKPSDNSAYVNMTARLALRHAIVCAERNGRHVPGRWRSIERGLHVPMDASGSVVVDHEGFRRNEEKAATPAALAALFPAGYQLVSTVERATIEYYLDLADDYVGSPMLSALYPTWAAWTGDRRRALRFLDSGYAAFTSPRFLNVHEYDPQKFAEQPVAGPFMANLAGFLLNLYLGFTGLQPSTDDPASWAKRPVCLPAGWECIEVERLHVRDRRAHLVAEHGELARMEMG